MSRLADLARHPLIDDDDLVTMTRYSLARRQKGVHMELMLAHAIRVRSHLLRDYTFDKGETITDALRKVRP